MQMESVYGIVRYSSCCSFLVESVPIGCMGGLGGTDETKHLYIGNDNDS